MIRNKLCGGIIRGSLCSYPISIEEGPEGQVQVRRTTIRSQQTMEKTFTYAPVVANDFICGANIQTTFTPGGRR